MAAYLKKFIVFIHNSLHSSRSTSSVTLEAKAIGTRKNPFDDMPPFNPSSPNQNKRMQKPSAAFNLDDDHFAANDSMLSQESHVINAWLALHVTYGKKIAKDRKTWVSKDNILKY